MTSQFQNKQKCHNCCNYENNDNIKNPLPGVMAKDQKFPSIYSAIKFISFNSKILQRLEPSADTYQAQDRSGKQALRFGCLRTQVDQQLEDLRQNSA